MKKYIVAFNSSDEGYFEAAGWIDGMSFDAEEFGKVTAYKVKIKVRAEFITKYPELEDLDCDVYSLDEFVDAFNEEDVNTAVHQIALVTVG